MHQADLMVSDISTACYEWFHFNRPIVYANPAPGKYFPSNNISDNTYAWQAGDVINKTDEIFKFVSENLELDKYKEIRNKLFNYTVFQPDGKATERQAQAIIDFYKRFEKTSYFWLILSSWLWGRGRRTATKLVHKYYKWFKKEKLGK
jgi:CDP-glycerol glycerophosphotransferase (TagB/SpsB family)